jgi:hypothetical protein
MRCLSLVLIGAALASCSTAPEPRSPQATAKLDKLLAGRVAGTPRDCLPTYRSGDMITIDENTILFRQGSRYWRNDPQGGCSGLGSGNYALVTKSYGSSGLCRGDIGRVMDLTTGIVVGSCSLGDFVPYTKPGA